MDEKAPAAETELENQTTEPADLNHLIGQVKAALENFKNDSTPENFAQLVTALGAIGLDTVKVWDEAAIYTKKHPLLVASCAGVLFFAFKGLFQSRRTSLAKATYH